MARRPNPSAASLQQLRSRRRTWFWVGMALLALPLTAVAVLSVLYARARYVPPQEEDPPVDTSPAAARRAEAHVREVETTIKKAQSDTKQGRKRPYRIAVKQEEINTLLRTSPRIRKIVEKNKIGRPYVRIENGRVRAGALVTYRDKPVYVTAEGPVVVEDGERVSFRLEDVWVGKVKAPAAMAEELSKRAAKVIASGSVLLPGQVESVRLEDGQLVIKGTTGRTGQTAAAAATTDQPSASPDKAPSRPEEEGRAPAAAARPSAMPTFAPSDGG